MATYASAAVEGEVEYASLRQRIELLGKRVEELRGALCLGDRPVSVTKNEPPMNVVLSEIMADSERLQEIGTSIEECTSMVLKIRDYLGGKLEH
jgi:malonyl CoA-acyl carrier protein transacylase